MKMTSCLYTRDKGDHCSVCRGLQYCTINEIEGYIFRFFYNKMIAVNLKGTYTGYDVLQFLNIENEIKSKIDNYDGKMKTLIPLEGKDIILMMNTFNKIVKVKYNGPKVGEALFKALFCYVSE